MSSNDKTKKKFVSRSLCVSISILNGALATPISITSLCKMGPAQPSGFATGTGWTSVAIVHGNTQSFARRWFVHFPIVRYDCSMCRLRVSRIWIYVCVYAAQCVCMCVWERKYVFQRICFVSIQDYITHTLIRAVDETKAVGFSK